MLLPKLTTRNNKAESIRRASSQDLCRPKTAHASLINVSATAGGGGDDSAANRVSIAQHALTGGGAESTAFAHGASTRVVFNTMRCRDAHKHKHRVYTRTLGTGAASLGF